MARPSGIGPRLRSRRGIAAVVAIVAVIAMAVVVGVKFLTPKISNTRAMCAEFTDAVGLYPGNKVALLGIEVGSMSSIVNKPDHVEVDFTVPADLDLPADVGAVTYSQSIVTDRHIELTKPYTGGPKFTGPGLHQAEVDQNPDQCQRNIRCHRQSHRRHLGIPNRARTPSKAPGVQAINDSLTAASRSLDGTGPGINRTMRNLVTMLADPYKADADYRQLFENSEILTSDFLDALGQLRLGHPNASGHHPVDGGPVRQLRCGAGQCVTPAADPGRGDQPVRAADLRQVRRPVLLAAGCTEQTQPGHHRHDQFVATVQQLDGRYLRAGVGHPQCHLHPAAGVDLADRRPAPSATDCSSAISRARRPRARRAPPRTRSPSA